MAATTVPHSREDIDADARLLPVDLANDPLLTAGIGVGRTVTDASPADRGQRPIELILLRQLASYLDMPIFVVDAVGRLVYYNEPAEPLLGVRFEEVGIMEMSDWLAAFRPGDHSGAPVPADEVPLVVALRERRPVHRDLSISGLDGVRRWIGATAFPLSGQGGSFIGAVAIFWLEPAA